MKKLSIALLIILTITILLHFATFTVSAMEIVIAGETQQLGLGFGARTIYEEKTYYNIGKDITAYALTCSIMREQPTKEIALLTYNNIFGLEKRKAQLVEKL